MKLKVRTSSPLSVAPSYISDIVDFIVTNIANRSLFEYFCLILKNSTDLTKFTSYKAKFVSPSSLEIKLLDLLNNFYTSAGSDIDKKRGDLLEHIVDKLLKGLAKYSSYTNNPQSVLDLIDSTSGSTIYTIHPHNIDFFIENPLNAEATCLECKISVEQISAQISSFNSLAGHLSSNNMNVLVNVIHPITDTVFPRLYARWYPNINFLGPIDIQQGNF